MELTRKVQYNTENYDIQSEYDPTTNYRFTAKVAGKYLVIAGLGMSSLVANKGFILTIRKNGSALTDGFNTYNSSTGRCTVVDVVDLAVNDYVEIYAFQQDTTSRNNVTNTRENYFRIHKIS